MAMSRWDPIHEMLPLRDAMLRLVEDSVVRPGATVGRAVTAPIDVYVDNDDYVLEVALPGVDPSQVNVQALGNQIAISGEYPTAPEGRQYLYRERVSGRFERSITLPTELDADKATAQYEHGLLRLRVPKAAAAKPRRIALSAGA